jgi:hypothetical protein
MARSTAASRSRSSTIQARSTRSSQGAFCTTSTRSGRRSTSSPGSPAPAPRRVRLEPHGRAYRRVVRGQHRLLVSAGLPPKGRPDLGRSGTRDTRGCIRTRRLRPELDASATRRGSSSGGPYCYRWLDGRRARRSSRAHRREGDSGRSVRYVGRTSRTRAPRVRS